MRPLVTLDNSKSPEYNIFSLTASRERRTHALLALVPHMPCTKDPREMRMKGPSTVGRCVTARLRLPCKPVGRCEQDNTIRHGNHVQWKQNKVKTSSRQAAPLKLYPDSRICNNKKKEKSTKSADQITNERRFPLILQAAPNHRVSRSRQTSSLAQPSLAGHILRATFRAVVRQVRRGKKQRGKKPHPCPSWKRHP